MEHSSDKNVLRPLTPYPIMRLGNVPIVAYSKPGSELVAERIAAVAAEANANAVLIANHGPIVAGSDLQNAVFAAEEMEEAAKLQILGDGLKLRLLNKDELAELVATMRLK
jgi:ribulose-5-phosphate 4-epimerase/fuculose-1-phosphate aldolase